MAFGQAAGISAYLSIKYNLAGREIPVRQIQEELLPAIGNPNADPAIVLHHFPDVTPKTEHYSAIQYLASRGLQSNAEKFLPEAPTTRGELVKWLQILGERAINSPSNKENSGLAYMGRELDFSALKEFSQLSEAEKPITRAEFANILIRVFPHFSENTNPNETRYSDISDSPNKSAITTLEKQGIDSRIWDGWKAYTKTEKLIFQPNANISHADVFGTLYIFQISLGPLFFDHPKDALNGRKIY